MSKETIIFRVSQDFQQHLQEIARSEEMPLSAYIRRALKLYTKYSKHTLIDKTVKDDIDLTDIEFPDEQ